MTTNCNDKRGIDKPLHGLAEYAIATAAYTALRLAGLGIAWSAALALAIAFAAGIAKEMMDARRKGNHFCRWDLAWDAAGAVCGLGVMIANEFV